MQRGSCPQGRAKHERSSWEAWNSRTFPAGGARAGRRSRRPPSSSSTPAQAVARGQHRSCIAPALSTFQQIQATRMASPFPVDTQRKWHIAKDGHFCLSLPPSLGPGGTASSLRNCSRAARTGAIGMRRRAQAPIACRWTLVRSDPRQTKIPTERCWRLTVLPGGSSPGPAAAPPRGPGRADSR